MRLNKTNAFKIVFCGIVFFLYACSGTGTQSDAEDSVFDDAANANANGPVIYTAAFRDENTLLLRLPLVEQQGRRGSFYVPAFNNNGKSVPERKGYVFTGWNDSVRGVGEFYAANQPLPEGKTSIVLYAQWMVSTREIAIYYNLKATLIDVNNAINGANSIYNDELLVGNGIFSDGENIEQNELMGRFLEKISEAETLLKGTRCDVPVQNIEKPNGELGTEVIHYYEYDFDAMERVTAEIKAIRNDALFDAGRFCVAEQTMTEPKIYSVTVTNTGYYDIELYGASGGHIWSRNDKTALGGLGGYAKGTIHINAGTVLKFRVGGEGKGTARNEGNQFNKIIDYAGDSAANYEGAHSGGFNGGGSGGESVNGYAGGSGGGGATDLRLKTGEAGIYKEGVNNWTFDTYDDFDLRVMVAGGGGGAAQSAEISNSWPGLAGGNAGESGLLKNNIAGPRAGGTAELAPMALSSGSATSGSVKGTGGAGNKGIPFEGTGGGGGGWFGGESVSTVANTESTSSGAGGSNYISGVFSDSTENAPSAAPATFGNGRAAIRWSAKN